VSFTQDLFSSRRNYPDGNTRINETDRIWYDSNTNVFRISNGVTPGGVIISSRAEIEYVYLSAYDTSTQTADANVGVANPITINSTDFSSNISNTNGNISLHYPGTYNLQFSAQLSNSSNSPADVWIWLRQNGQDISQSSGIVTVPQFHGSKPGRTISSWNYLIDTANYDEFVQLYWWSDEPADVSLSEVAAQTPTLTNPAIPESPSVILTVCAVRLKTT
jgi:hypothetical protein